MSSPSGEEVGVGFRDPFVSVKGGKREEREAAGGRETLQDELKRIYEKKGQIWEEDEMGEMMLRGGSDMSGKGVGVWRVE